MRNKTYYVYILASTSRSLYIGVTCDIERRLNQHRGGRGGRFTGSYRNRWLVHLETTNDVIAAITREKELKGWRRAKKVALIERTNPQWKDLSRDV
jgi:putative endonuclease